MRRCTACCVTAPSAPEKYFLKWKEDEADASRHLLDKYLLKMCEKGRRYLLKRVEFEAAPAIELKHSKLVLQVRPGTNELRSREILDAWYRDQIRATVPELIAKWEPVLGVRVGRVFVQRMKTRWGSCNPATGAIRLNTDLAKKPPECLEYIVVHEMTHLLEPSHNARFVSLMALFMPQWQHLRDELNALPVRHEDWGY